MSESTHVKMPHSWKSHALAHGHICLSGPMVNLSISLQNESDDAKGKFQEISNAYKNLTEGRQSELLGHFC